VRTLCHLLLLFSLLHQLVLCLSLLGRWLSLCPCRLLLHGVLCLSHRWGSAVIVLLPATVSGYGFIRGRPFGLILVAVR
jgi:hypothetical protein